MGRWTPLILMAGGLAILLGTLLGINFPMDGRKAETPRKRESQVLPANINVNTTGPEPSGENGNQNNVAQNNNNNNQETVQTAPTTTAQGNTSTTGSTTTPSNSTAQGESTSGNKAPIRALW